MKKNLIVAGIVLVIVGAGVFVYKNIKEKEVKEVVNIPQDNSIIVNGGNFYFKPNIIKVKQGDRVDITFVNNEGFHDFKIDEYNISTNRIKDGGQEKITFVADKKGSFEYYCSVGTHRQMGMKGTLVVE